MGELAGFAKLKPDKGIVEITLSLDAINNAPIHKSRDNRLFVKTSVKMNELASLIEGSKYVIPVEVIKE